MIAGAGWEGRAGTSNCALHEPTGKQNIPRGCEVKCRTHPTHHRVIPNRDVIPIPLRFLPLRRTLHPVHMLREPLSQRGVQRGGDGQVGQRLGDEEEVAALRGQRTCR